MELKVGNIELKYFPLCRLKMINYGQFHMFQPRYDTHLEWIQT